eukprot:TRINITY_DN10277_c0_g2_i1.p2 TRINITY_DN10277_c0_g2~~TRINITY_DN10277_c0_g2_i1.p2  ORF type:complete len:122 (+),score=37.69 TRINITY_DN10277_c0_g2_i1:54-368(+)
MAVCGGVGAAQPVNEEVIAMCNDLKVSAQDKANASGWNGVFTTFEPISYASQVVAGTNFFVKVKVSDTQYAHVRIFRPLPHTGAPAEVHSVQMGKSVDDEIVHF